MKNTEFAKHSKIIEAALKSQFSNPQTIKALLEVISETNNYIVATETLLNVYQEPEFVAAHPDCDPEIQDKFVVYYDKYTDTVKYEGSKPVYKDGADYIVTEYTMHQGTCSRKKWETGSRW